ncbi:hypothetical protein [Corynebacterium sphenisci]|uniref:hypothetical protein n=1 Tax=Corynebacterium sphenisci TaxID=191493 RepID=UPI0026E0A816|nr:hypothetical protein [Corynebacterium sphenisci]
MDVGGDAPIGLAVVPALQGAQFDPRILLPPGLGLERAAAVLEGIMIRMGLAPEGHHVDQLRRRVALPLVPVARVDGTFGE